ncbi:MAG: hypothetical protein IJD41_00595 [Alphaproteobacteria bacterium]|nr:hypothetical protein [Alphaproteobacteria bacterium]
MRVFFFILILLVVPGISIADIASTTYASSADNITHGTLSVEHLPVGTGDDTVAAGNDARFETIAIGEPDASVPDGRALIWIE